MYKNKIIVGNFRGLPRILATLSARVTVSFQCAWSQSL